MMINTTFLLSKDRLVTIGIRQFQIIVYKEKMAKFKEHIFHINCLIILLGYAI